MIYFKLLSMKDASLSDMHDILSYASTRCVYQRCVYSIAQRCRDTCLGISVATMIEVCVGACWCVCVGIGGLVVYVCIREATTDALATHYSSSHYICV